MKHLQSYYMYILTWLLWETDQGWRSSAKASTKAAVFDFSEPHLLGHLVASLVCVSSIECR